jgi:hypothetical protein
MFYIPICQRTRHKDTNLLINLIEFLRHILKKLAINMHGCVARVGIEPTTFGFSLNALQRSTIELSSPKRGTHRKTPVCVKIL